MAKVPTDQKQIADRAIGSAQVAQEGADFGKAAGFAEPLINRAVNKTVDYARTNTDPAILQTDTGTSNDGGTGSDCIP